MKTIKSIIIFITLISHSIVFSQTLPFNFSNPIHLMTGQEGTTTSIITDAGNPVLQIVGGTGLYDHAVVVLAQNVNLSNDANNTITFRIKSNIAGTRNHWLKFEQGVGGPATTELSFTTTGTEWQNISLNFPAGLGNYARIVIFTDFNNTLTGTYLIDDFDGGTNVSAPVVLAPTVAAPTPPARNATDVINLYSSAYTEIAGTNWNPNWGQSTVASEVQIAGNATIRMSNLNYQGAVIAAAQNVSTMTNLHIDVWTPDCNSFSVFLISVSPLLESAVTLTPTFSGWNSFDIPLSSYTLPDLTAIVYFKFISVTPGTTVYMDNIYFWKPDTQIPSTSNTQNLCTKTIQPYNVNDGDATHDGSTYDWSISPAAPNAIITGNGTNSITIDWTNVPDGSYTLQAIETSIEGCISIAVAATINITATPAPTSLEQTYCASATVANLTATGTNIKWYAAANGGTVLATSTVLETGTYYASQTINGCESARTAVAVTITPQITPLFTQIASTCSGFNLTALPITSINGISGTWSPALNNTVTTTYSFTPNIGQCANSSSQTINITTPKVTSEISFVAPQVTVATLPNVTIGTQIWTNKNLDVTTYRDGTPIPQITDPTAWAELTTGAWCYYNNDPANGAIYGKLYNWYAVAGIYDNDPNTPNKTLAPIGWHIGSENEWNTLAAFLGGESVSAGKMKATGTVLWASPNSDATNSSGFTGLPGGYRFNQGSFNFINEFGIWWSSSETSATEAWGRSLNYGNGNENANSGSANKAFGGSVRIIKN